MSGRVGLVASMALLLCLACGHVDKEKTSGAGGNNAGDHASVACSDYCDTVMAACTGENAVYASEAACLALCALLDAGDPGEPTGNTLACRSGYAQEAERDPADACASAGPGGDGACGSDCEAYCALYPQVCPDEADAQGTEQCLEQCGALADRQGFDVVADHEGDTVECRLVHLTSATLQPAQHCQHAQLEPTQPWCVAEP